jgi:ComF family protein
MAYGTDSLICSAHKELPYISGSTCFRCGKEIENAEAEYCPDCAGRSHGYDRGFPVFNYAAPVRESVLAIKYKNKREYCRYYIEEMSTRLIPVISTYKIDALVPVPIHRKKQKSRGYNQALILAQGIGKKLGVPVYGDMLIRQQPTTPQKKLDSEERYKNIKGAIVPGKAHEDCKKVMIIDDIYTTGATVNACANGLKKLGVQKVYYSAICIGQGRGF